MRNAFTVLASITFVALFLVGCDSDESAPAASADTVTASPTAELTENATPTSTTRAGVAAIENERIVPDGPLYGIAGLIPPNFPASTDADYLAFFAALPALGGTVGNYAPLDDLADNQEVGIAAGLQVLPVTGFHREVDGALEVTVDFGDAAQRESFIDGLVDFVETYRPPYLGVGNEVNRVWEADPAAFDAWAAALPEIVDAVHEASPRTAVFATFQYEFLAGLDTITGEGRVEDWTPFDIAAPYLDLVAFTSYPYFAFEAPSDVPSDYYAAIREHTDRPVGFTELGWPSAPIRPLEGSPLAGLGGSPEEQEAFIARLEELLAPVAPKFALWVWAYDTPAVDSTFESLGLSSQRAEAKPALDAWRAFVGTK